MRATSGPARAFAERGRHFAEATGTTDLYQNVHWETGEVTETGDAAAVLDGIVVYGPDEVLGRELTEFELRNDGERWLVDSYLRNHTGPATAPATLSTASRSQPPTKTDRPNSSSRSAGSRRSTLQEIVS